MASRRRRIDPDIHEEIVARVLEHWTPSKIHQWLETSFEDKSRLPSLRTVQRIVSDITAEDRSGPWSLRQAEGDDARLILDVLAVFLERTTRQRVYLTKTEADYVLKIRKAVPDEDLWAVFRLARLYVLREVKGEDTHDLDGYLAFRAGVRSDETRMETYRRVHQRLWSGSVRIRLPPLAIVPCVDEIEPSFEEDS